MFKVGDRVIRVRPRRHTSIAVGALGTVKAVHGSYIEVDYDVGWAGVCVLTTEGAHMLYNGELTDEINVALVRGKIKEAA